MDIIKYILQENLGEIKLNDKGKQLKKIIIDNREYTYNKNKPLSNKLKKKLNRIAQSNQYRAREILKKAKVKKTLKSYAIKQKAHITNEESAFKSYTNSYSISNINLKGLRGLSYLKYQNERLVQFLNNNPSMKIIIIVTVTTDEGEINFKSRRYEINNRGEIK